MARSEKIVEGKVWEDDTCEVVFGRLEPRRGYKAQVENLFLCIGEKLPFECLPAVHRHIKNHPISHREGVYIAHDAFGIPRYAGRGKIFSRLRARKRKYPKHLAYFSFYIVQNKNHERELENAILRASGPQTVINKVKVRGDATPGSVRDYEPGTRFFQRRDSRENKRKKSH
jgi:hypothetical protein